MVPHAARVSAVILLLGGTSETAPLAQAMLAAGWPVLVSTATDAPLELPPGVERRCGRLDAQGLAALCRMRNVKALVDASHPYATALHAEAARAADWISIPYLRFARPTYPTPTGALQAATHEDAARLAFGLGQPVALTIGSRNLAPYVRMSRGKNIPILARVLDHPESLAACRMAGLAPDEITTGRGPFTIEENVHLLRRIGAGTLVTKDSGSAGGLRAKAEAARMQEAVLVVVQRPEDVGLDAITLLEEVRQVMEASR